MVGFCDVLQQTPRVATVAPPSEDICPPQVAELSVTFVTELVVTVGNITPFVVNDTTSPYLVSEPLFT